jgi:Ca2+-binding RTX toxin-like protein
MRARRRGVLAMSATAAVLATGAIGTTPAFADGCSLTGSTATYVFGPPPAGTPPPNDDGFPTEGTSFRRFGPFLSSECQLAGATVTNTDRIVVSDSSGGFDQRVTIDERAGRFAPGATDEGDGSSEIEWDIDLGPPNSVGLDNVYLSLALGDHEVRVGTIGGETMVNSNAESESDATADADIRLAGLDRVARSGRRLLRAEFFFVTGFGGDDVLTGAGGPEFDGAADVSLLLKGREGDNTVIGGAAADRLQAGTGADLIVGGPGRDLLDSDRGSDRLRGGPGNDLLDAGGGPDRLKGGSGRDTYEAGPGRDKIKARDGKREKIDCGPGVDRVSADRKDRVARNCERVRKR